MGYLPPVRNDQYIQYANRSISQKSNYAYIQKPPISQASAPTAKSKKERKIRLRLLGGSRKKAEKSAQPPCCEKDGKRALRQ